jgi:hypothetical protein
MARHKLTPREQLRGLRKCLRSKKTPAHLKPSIRRYVRKLEAELHPSR